MSPEPLPLAAAGQRLRGRPGRPRKVATPDVPSARTIHEAAVRLLDLEGTAAYLSVSDRPVC